MALGIFSYVHDKVVRIRATCWVGVWGSAIAYVGLWVYAFRCLTHPLSFWRTYSRNTPEILSDMEWGSAGNVDVKGKNISFMKKGDHTKPMILFIHGFPEFWFTWRHQLQYFGNSYWAVAVDLPGIGDSDMPSNKDYSIENTAAMLIDFVKALGRDNCVVVGSGLGGMIAWEMAAKKPEMVDKLIVVNATRFQLLVSATHTSWSQFINSWYLVASKIPCFPEIFIRSQDFSVFSGMLKGLSKDELEAYKYAFGKNGAVHNGLEYYRSLDFQMAYNPTNLAPISVPTLLILGGKRGQALTQEVVDPHKIEASNCTVKVLQDSGAHPQWEDPIAFNKIVADYVN